MMRGEPKVYLVAGRLMMKGQSVAAAQWLNEEETGLIEENLGNQL